jgi:alginate O-acetyltransferase complex protein AlgI
MLFVTRDFFLEFLPIVLAAFHVALAFGFSRLLLPILLVASVAFYAWGNPTHLPILGTSIIVNYFTGRAIAELGMSPNRRKFVFNAAIVYNLGQLAFFKYTNFAVGNLAWLMGFEPPHLDIVLPIGIFPFIPSRRSHLCRSRSP